ncbi:hypothetical protein [Streptosporangium canum]|uniref:hypothetical protein n=1 Tax=Streptosporangium canum TaxID=324952 RepID=UPI0037BDF110
MPPQELEAVRARLETLAAEVSSCFARVDQQWWDERYVRGLLTDGARQIVTAAGRRALHTVTWRAGSKGRCAPGSPRCGVWCAWRRSAGASSMIPDRPAGVSFRPVEAPEDLPGSFAGDVVESAVDAPPSGCVHRVPRLRPPRQE